MFALKVVLSMFTTKYTKMQYSCQSLYIFMMNCQHACRDLHSSHIFLDGESMVRYNKPMNTRVQQGQSGRGGSRDAMQIKTGISAPGKKRALYKLKYTYYSNNTLHVM